jgi:hypothetical protein
VLADRVFGDSWQAPQRHVLSWVSGRLLYTSPSHLPANPMLSAVDSFIVAQQATLGQYMALKEK